VKPAEGDDADWTAAELSVLRSAERDEPSPGSLDRTLTALGAGTAFADGLGGASAASKLKVIANFGRGWLKLPLLGTVLVVGGIAGIAISTHGRARVATPPPTTQTRPAGAVLAAPSAPAVSPALTGDEPTPPASATALVPRSAQAPVKDARGSDKDSLAAEIRLIDEARHRLHQGDPRGALATLAGYEQLVKRGGSMRAEATVVRVESLQASGDKAQAAKIGQRFVAENPNSPYVGYLQRLLSR